MDIHAIEPRFESYVGIVSPPASFDWSAHAFTRLAPERVGVIQHVCPPGSVTYGDLAGDSGQHVFEAGVEALAACSVNIIGQLGGYWALTFTADEEASRRLEERMRAETGLEIVLSWSAMIDALRHLGARRIALTTGYYRPD